MLTLIYIKFYLLLINITPFFFINSARVSLSFLKLTGSKCQKLKSHSWYVKYAIVPTSWWVITYTNISLNVNIDPGITWNYMDLLLRLNFFNNWDLIYTYVCTLHIKKENNFQRNMKTTISKLNNFCTHCMVNETILTRLLRLKAGTNY